MHYEPAENDRDDDLCVCEHPREWHDKKPASWFPEGCIVCAVSPVRTPCEKFQEAK